jgi:NHS family xanthosine MFS transporter
MMTNGVGAYLGSKISGEVIDAYFTVGADKQWSGIWLSFSGYALVVAILFAIMFKSPVEKVQKFSH